MRRKGKFSRTTYEEETRTENGNSDDILSTLLKCPFVKAEVVGQSLKLCLRVKPEEGDNHILSAFALGNVRCKTVSAKVVPVEVSDSCDACGSLSSRRETVLNFTIVASSDFSSDCVICHDHGSLSKYWEGDEDSSSHGQASGHVTKEVEKKRQLDRSFRTSESKMKDVKNKKQPVECSRTSVDDCFSRNTRNESKSTGWQSICEDNIDDVSEELQGQNYDLELAAWEQVEINSVSAVDQETQITDKQSGVKDVADNLTSVLDITDKQSSVLYIKDKQSSVLDITGGLDITGEQSSVLDITGEQSSVLDITDKQSSVLDITDKVSMKQKSDESENEIQLDKTKKTFSCQTCGGKKKYASQECQTCPNVVKQHLCKYCERSFDSVLTLVEHKVTHDSERPYLCCECGDTFTRKYYLEAHTRKHKGIKRFKCDVCDKKYDDSTLLKVHIRTHTGERPHQCNTCGKGLTSAPALRVHVRAHAKSMFPCTICGKTFHRNADLSCHECTHTGALPFKCSVCDKGFTCSAHLKRHMWLHNKPRSHKCDQCTKAFYTLNDLKVHKRVHTGERPFKCNVCQKTFTMSGSLKKHMMGHGISKSFTCGTCDKNFESILQLKSHKKIQMERNFVCELCGKRFLSISKLKSHDNSHKGIKKNTCDQCGKAYRNASYLKIHKKTHTGDNLIQCHTCGDWFTDPSYFKLHQKKFCKGNPLYCEVCGLDFPHNRALISHMGMHTGERPFACEICGKAFTKQESLSEHVKRHNDRSFKCKICGKDFINGNELRKHEKSHTKVKLKASLPDSLKPGYQESTSHDNGSQIIYQPEIPGTSSRVKTEVLSLETRQATQHLADNNAPEDLITNISNLAEDHRHFVHPVDMKPVVQYIQVSRGSSSHIPQAHVNPGRHGDIVYTRSFPTTNQTTDMMSLQLHSGSHDVVVEEQCEDVQMICSDFE